jgi:hypothetical protein
MRKSFSFEGNQIHRINQVHENHKYVIQVRYSKSQFAVISNKSLKHIRHSELLFAINFPKHFNDQKPSGMNDLISCFNSIDSLFHSQTEINLTESNYHAFEYLSNYLDKRSLSKHAKK